MKATIFKNIFDKQPHIIGVDVLLNRIRTGKSREQIEAIRNALDKERANKLKCYLPSICFSGEFGERTDVGLVKHNGLVCLDFDDVPEPEAYKKELAQKPFIYACWISPSGKGVKALVKIAKPNKHREHFAALQNEFGNLDASGVNVSRVCYESWDVNIIVNPGATTFTKLVEQQTHTAKVTEVVDDAAVVFKNILVWITNKGNAFVTGERNVFMFKLAGACCRFGLLEHEAYQCCANEFLINDNTFTSGELRRVIQSAYKANAKEFGTAKFERDELVHTTTKKVIELDADLYNPDVKPKDVIFGEDVMGEALNIYDNGHEQLNGVGVPDLDTHFKLKRGEITLLTGIGNYGKSSFLKWYLTMRMVVHNEKFVLFAPEDNPAHEFYHDMVEVLLGMDCTPRNPKKPPRGVYERAYKRVSEHFYYVYPEAIAPTPDYIKQRFLEMIIKHKVDGVIIDPFNQMSNDYNVHGGRTDKYLETFLSDCSRFAQTNNVYFITVAHPKLMRKDASGNYPCPDVYDVADGAMWNNKMDNILVYHRPEHQLNPGSPVCELHTKKIRRQKIVGRKGVVTFELDFMRRRFTFNGTDVMSQYLHNTQQTLDAWQNEEFLNDLNDIRVADAAPF